VLLPCVGDELYTDEDGNKVGAVHLSEIPNELYEIFDGVIAQFEDAIFKSFAAKDEEAEGRTRALREYYYRAKKFRNAMEAFDSAYEFFIFMEGGKLRTKCFCIDPSRSIAKRLQKGSSATFFSGTLSPMYYYRATLGDDRTSDMLEVASPFDPSQISVSIMDKISTRLSERDDSLGAVCRVIAATVSAKRGNYMIFSPSFAYSEALARIFRAKYPKIKVIEQRKNMTAAEKREFLAEFEKESESYLIGFCVMGGIYSEGVDLAGDSLIGAVIVGIGIPALSYEREAISAYYNEKYEEGKQFAYIYPGMNRVLQAAGRVIRREEDKGVVVLIDDRFDDPIYRTVIPKLWDGMKFIADPKELRAELDEFWKQK
jgi:DNA excision repair protein ERCC-2